jgi:hypothetical protein
MVQNIFLFFLSQNLLACGTGLRFKKVRKAGKATNHSLISG